MGVGSEQFKDLIYMGKSDKYKGVGVVRSRKTHIIYFKVNKTGKLYEDERIAGKQVDLLLIKEGKQPINILKKL